VPYQKTFEIAWALLDANGHMANTGYMQLCIDSRFAYFESQGFAPTDFQANRVGPVVRRDELEYFRELNLLDKVTVSLMLAAAAPDASRFVLRNEIRRADGELAARISSSGGWLDLEKRRLRAPPEKLARALLALDRTEDFSPLESAVKAPA
jgi:acyl-CoA thioester hydrolase